jgi:hypothetical protein
MLPGLRSMYANMYVPERELFMAELLAASVDYLRGYPD